MKKIISKAKILASLFAVLAGLSANAVTLAEAIDMPGASLSGSWTYTSQSSCTGGYSAKSTNTGDSTSSYMQLQVSGSGTLSFCWSVSSESNYDWLSVQIDGVAQEDRISGSQSWTSKSYTISGSGTHTIRWVYSKDGSVTRDSDCGYVDCVRWVPAGPTTWYVDATNGNDGYNGKSSSQAKRTIQAAIDAAASSDTIHVAAGVYSPINVSKALTIIGAGAERTFIDGGNSSRCATFSSTSGYVLRGVTLRNGYSGSSDGGGAYYGTLEDCVITNCATAVNRSTTDPTRDGGGAYRSNLTRCTIVGCTSENGGGLSYATARHCILKNNRAVDDGGALWNSTAYNCLVVGNIAENVVGANAGGGAYYSTLYNCTVTGNRNLSSTGAGGLDNSYAYNCIIYGNSSYNSSYNELYSMRSTQYCTTSDPKFVNPAGGDYRLQINSPCIDVGRNSYVEDETDLAGQPRIVNSTVDIGAYERGVSSCSIASSAPGIYEISYELAEDAREAELKLNGTVMMSTTNDVERQIWQPTRTGSHIFIFTSGGFAETQTVNVATLAYATSSEPNPPMSTDPSVAITPPARSIAASGGARTITTSGSGTWTAASSVSWITLKETSGDAGTSVAYTVSLSDAVGERVGYVYVSGYTHTITQSGYEADANPTSFESGPDGMTGSVSVGMSGRFAWTARPNVDWISLSKTSGTGADTLMFTVAPLVNVTTRTGTFTVAGKTVTVTQTGRAMRISSNGGEYDYYTHVVPITVDALASQSWSVEPHATWISVLSPSSGSGRGSGSVSLAIGENPSFLARTGRVTIGPETYTVTQAGRPAERLSFSISPMATTANVMGANGSIAVTATPDLPWTVTSQASWLTVVPDSQRGAGNGNIAYTAQPNPTLSERTGTITVTPQVGTAKQQTVTQPAAQATVSPTVCEFAPAGESFGITVTVDPHVQWTINESIEWLSVAGSASRTGPATLTLTASANNSIDARIGSLTIAGHTINVSQLGRSVEIVDGNCNRVFGTESMDGTIDIHPDGDVAWHAEASHSWITIVSETSGTGNATILYVIDDYLGDGRSRTGWITIGGTKVYITQRAYELDINPKAATVSGNNGAGEIGISAPIGAVWDAIATEPWLTLQKNYDPTTGRGTVVYTVAENDTGRTRTGMIIINGEAYTVTQMERLNVPVQGRGGVRVEGTYGVGAMMSLTATNAPDYEFSRWTGALTGSANPASVVLEDVRRVTAVFTPIAPTLTATTANRESVNLSWNARAWANNYLIYRSETTTMPSAPLVSVSDAASYADASALPGVTYYYWVQAVGPQASDLATSGRVSGLRPVSLTGIEISGSADVFAGRSARYTCTAAYNNGTRSSVTPTWSVTGSAATMSGGVLTGKSTVSADSSVTVRASYTSDGITKTASFNVTVRPVVGLDTIKSGTLSSVTTGGNGTWFGQTLDLCGSAASARSPSLVSGQSAWFTTRVSGPGTLRFKWRKTAADEGVAFIVGSVQTETLSVVSDWRTVERSFRDTATRTFKWQYTAGATGSAYALVGDIVWTPAPASVTLTLNYQDGVTENTTKTCSTGSAIGTLPVPVRAGYEFLGWYEEPSGVTRVQSTDLSFVCDTTIYAKWSAKEYTVRFHRDNGTSDMYTRKYLVDVAAPVPDMVSEIGWVTDASRFVGWSKTRGSSVVAYADGAELKNATTTVGATVDLYPVWVGSNEYRLIFNRNYSPGDTAAAGQKVRRGVATELPWKDSAFGFSTPAGKTFLGWNADPNATTAMFVNGEKVTNISKPGGTVYLYAVWRDTAPQTYTIRFHKNDGSGTVVTRSFVSGRNHDLPWINGGLGWTNPAGCNIVGWARAASATAKEWSNGEYVKDLAAAGATINLYVVWSGTTRAAASASMFASPRLSAAPPAPMGETETLPSHITGLFADGSGIFDLILDDPESELTSAYFAAQTDNGVWSEECEVERFGETLVVTFEEFIIIVRLEDGESLAVWQE